MEANGVYACAMTWVPQLQMGRERRHHPLL